MFFLGISSKGHNIFVLNFIDSIDGHMAVTYKEYTTGATDAVQEIIYVNALMFTVIFCSLRAKVKV